MFAIIYVHFYLDMHLRTHFFSNFFHFLLTPKNKKIDLDDESWVIRNAKNLILSQHPILETFCNEDENIVKAKLETYKAFNNSTIELTQDPNYYFPNIKL